MRTVRKVEGKINVQKLGDAITAKGYSRHDFAVAAGISEATLYKVLNGKHQPSVVLSKMMCLLLGVPEDTFLVKSEPPKPEPPTEQAQDNHALEEAVDKLIVYLERIERKQDRLEMLVRSVQNENLALRQELLKRK